MSRLITPVSRRSLAVLTGSSFSSPSSSSFLLRRPLSTTAPTFAKDTHSTPGWEGRGTEGHAVNRSQHDPVSKGAQQGIKDKQQGGEDSQAISQKGGSANKKAEQEHPEAPQPVIGMNEERGEVSLVWSVRV